MHSVKHFDSGFVIVQCCIIMTSFGHRQNHFFLSSITSWCQKSYFILQEVFAGVLYFFFWQQRPPRLALMVRNSGASHFLKKTKAGSFLSSFFRALFLEVEKKILCSLIFIPSQLRKVKSSSLKYARSQFHKQNRKASSGLEREKIIWWDLNSSRVVHVLESLTM